jgi:hypothetical protein
MVRDGVLELLRHLREIVAGPMRCPSHTGVVVQIRLRRLVADRIRERSDASRGRLVLPSDVPTVAVPGPDPFRVLLIGSGPAAGVGVDSHSDALTGALARQLSERSGRGSVVDSLGIAHSRVSDLPGVLSAVPPGGFDAVVVAAGMMEAVDMTSNASWERWLLAVLEMVQARFGSNVPIVVSGMPAPTGAILAGAGRRGRFIDRRAIDLNRTSRLVTATQEHWHFAQLQPSAHVKGQPTSASYAEWAVDIAVVLAPALAAARI